MEDPVKILLADDHQIFREGLKALLEENENLKVTLQASNGKQALKLLAENPVDLVMIDIHMPVMNGIECTLEIRKSYPDLPVIALTMAVDESHITKMIKAGANGYLLKNSGSRELMKAIEKVLEGEQFYSQKVGQVIMDGLVGKRRQSSKASPESILTRREIEILKLIAREFSNREISEKLFISVRTVDAHRRNILQKIGARNTAGITRYALEHFDLDSEP